MVTYIAVALAAVSAVLSAWLYTRVRALESQAYVQDAAMSRLASAARSYKKHIEDLYGLTDKLAYDLDLLASEGQAQPPKTSPGPVAAPDLSNQRELNDGLPLQGHTLIVGQSGSGKSNLLMSQIIRRLRDGQELHCIDTKDEIEPIFGGSVQCVPTEMAEQKFRQMLRVAKERRQLFASVSQMRSRPVRDYGEYFKVTGERLPIICLVVEELIVLMGKVDEDLLIELLVTGRSAGVFVVCLAQYIKADILSRKGTINFNTTVFMGKYDGIAAGLLFGNMEKEETRALRDFLGTPGKGAVMEKGQLRTASFPQVTEDYLLPFFSADGNMAPIKVDDDGLPGDDEEEEWWDEEE